MTADLIFFQFRTRGTEEKEVFLMPPQLERRAPDRVCKFEVPYLFPYLYKVEVDESGKYRNDECTYEKTESYLFAEGHQVYNIRRRQKRKKCRYLSSRCRHGYLFHAVHRNGMDVDYACRISPMCTPVLQEVRCDFS